MIDIARVEHILRRRYPDLEPVGKNVFRGVDRHAEREYAVRYFDLNDELTKTSQSLKRYQEEMLSEMYFSSKTATDLRWNHYLYFITSTGQAQQSEFKRTKAAVEADREYARKQVVLEGELANLLAKEESPKASSSLPLDLATTWMNRLNDSGLGYVLDEQITVPEVVRRIKTGQKDNASKVVSPLELLPAEKAAASHFLKRLTIHGFRPHPVEKDHRLGRVNLIVGTNGVGKTSLLEAIEYAYCGRNRRAGVVTTDTSIVAEMVRSGEKLSSTTAPARLRARHSNWYAKTELKTITIQDSFGKFNFLDTDAAVNLSVAGSTQQIGADVSRLLLGAEAEKLSDRLRRVRDKLHDDLKDLERDTSLKEQLALAVQNRLAALSQAPKPSDSLFKELLIALQETGWQQMPISKSDAGNMRQALQRAIASVELLQRSAVDVLRSDEESVKQYWMELEDAAQQAADFDERQKSAALEAVEVQRKLQTITGRISTIDSLLPYAREKFQDVFAQRDALQHSVNTRTPKLVVFGSPQRIDIVADFHDQATTIAAVSVAARLTELRKRLQTAQDALETFEAAQSGLALLRQRLLSTAKELLQRTSNPDHCPVCHTEFEQGELMVRMLADSASDASDQLGRLQIEATSIQAEIASAEMEDSILRRLVQFLGRSAGSTPVAQALALVEQERATLERDTAELSTIKERLVQFQSNGLTANDLSQKLAAAGVLALQSEEELHILRADVAATLPDLQAERQAVQDKLAKVQQDAEVLATRFSINISISPDDLARQIRGQLNSFETAVEARQSLSLLVQLASATTLQRLAVNLAASQELLVKVVTADAQEISDNAALAKETKTINDLKQSIEDHKVAIGRLNEADGLFNELIEQSSGGELAEQILAENALEIGRTFSSIHVPNEFELKAENGKLRIIRRQSGSEVDLNEMSTGQRAAFALSLFLAMNARLQSGPPVLLFDDPVAHVDDVNVLSFLDHLRDLAIKGSRQIFFATADTKLAGLFRHKFRFLGGEDFSEIQLTRE